MIVTILVCTGAGVAAGLSRKPSYTATTRLAVLHLNFGAPGALAGFSTAAEALADTYARAVQADGVVLPLAARLHRSPQAIRDDLSAASVPQSPVFSVSATTKARATAIALANMAARALTRYARAVSASNPDAKRLYRDLTRAEGVVVSLQVTLSRLQAGVHGSAAPSRLTQLAINRAQTDLSAAKDRVDALRAAYAQNIGGTSSTGFIQPLQSATTVTSDRKSKLALLAFVGAAVGIAVGVGLALARQGARSRATGR